MTTTTKAAGEKPKPRLRMTAKQKAALQAIEWEGRRTTLTSGAVEVRKKDGDLVWIDREGNVEKVTEVNGGQADVGPRADSVAHDAPTLEAMLIGASISRLGAKRLAAVLEELEITGATPPIDEQRQRMAAYLNGTAKSGLTGKEAALWVILGDDGRKAHADRERLAAQMRKSTATGSRRARAAAPADAEPSDVRAAELATETAAAKGKKLSQRVSAKEAAKARVVVVMAVIEARKAGKFPNAPTGDLSHTELANLIPATLGFKSERAFKRYVTGEETALEDDAKVGVKALTKGIDSHQVWARKAAAAAFGVMLQMRETDAS